MAKRTKSAQKKRSPQPGKSFSFSAFADDHTNQRDTPALTQLWVEGWKSLVERTTLSLSGLTVLAGANSSGKSSLFQPVLMLKQTLEAPYDPGALLLDGPHVKFTEATQFLCTQRNGKQFADLVIGMRTAKDLIQATYTKTAGKPIEVVQETFGIGADETTIRFDMSEADVKQQLGKSGNDLVELFTKNSQRTKLSVRRNRCFLGVELSIHNDASHQFSLMVESNQTGEVLNALRSIIHLPGLRGNPERTYPLNATEGFYPGQFQSYTASLIQRWKDSKHQQKLSELNRSLATLGLTSGITTDPVDETRVEIKVGRLLADGCQEFVSIADVGLAVSQVLPVLVALVVARPGQLVFVEQPELHLHPRAQVKLATIMAAAIKRGVRILIETHSSLLLLGIQTAIASGELSHDDVSLHWFTRNAQGVTKVTEAALDAVGSFGDWPEDFADVSLEAEGAYIRAAEQALLAGHNAR